MIEGKDGVSAADMVCPARIQRQEGNPTLWVNSIGGTLAGWHCDVMKGDDIVNEDNSNNDDTREKLKHRYDNVSANLPDEWAFRDQLGTRYFPDDWYGDRIADAKLYSDTNDLKYLCRSAWTVHPQFAHVPIKQLQPHMVDLYFPEKLTFKTLLSKCRSNETQFRCQQLNEPAGGDVICRFEEEVIKSHTIILNAVPRPEVGERRLRIIWDTAHTSDNAQSDYSAGVVGYCHDETRALYVLEVDFGKWKDSETAVHLTDLHWKWNALTTEVEKFAGWELFAAEVQRYSMLRYRKYVPLVWRTADRTSNAKANRIKGLESLLSNDRLWFVEGDWMDIATRQFVRFTGERTKRHRRDDIPDAIAGLQRMIPGERHTAEDVNESDAMRKSREARELKERFSDQQRSQEYGTIFAAPPPPPAQPKEPRVRIDTGPGWVFGNTGIHL